VLKHVVHIVTTGLYRVKKGGNLNLDKRLTTNAQITEVADERNCLGATFESRGWKLKTIAKGNQTSVAVDKCLARTPDSRAKLLKKIYEMVNKPRLVCGIDMWGLDR
jgi:hypothetical protein